MKEHETTPALYFHCVTVYRKMMEDAKMEETDDGQKLVVWEGFTTQVFIDLGLTVPYYTSVMQKLRSMDCVRQIRRGGGGSPSKWLMLHEPTEQLFARATQIRQRKPEKEEASMQLIRDLNRRVTKLEERFDAYVPGGEQLSEVSETGT